MFTQEATIRAQMAGCTHKIYTHAQLERMVSKMIDNTLVFGHTSLDVDIPFASHTLRYTINLIPTVTCNGVQTPAVFLLKTEGDEILLRANFNLQTAFGIELSTPVEVVYYNRIEKKLTTTKEERYNVEEVVANSPALSTSNLHNELTAYHCYHGILYTKVHKYGKIHPLPVSTVYPNAPTTVKVGISKAMINKGVPESWTVYPPKVLIKAANKLFTYRSTDGWIEVADVHTVDASVIAQQGINYNTFNELTVPEELYLMHTAGVCGETEQSVPHIEVVSVGWPLSVVISPELWYNRLQVEQVVQAQHNGKYWLFLCSDIQ